MKLTTITRSGTNQLHYNWATNHADMELVAGLLSKGLEALPNLDKRRYPEVNELKNRMRSMLRELSDGLRDAEDRAEVDGLVISDGKCT